MPSRELPYPPVISLPIVEKLFGSDWPHPEGLAGPVRYVDELSTMTPDEQAKVMGGNLARLVGV
jgi:predicted TIM-barrel fold metal-dependent hydrolase